jgi:hypothetical protein
MGPYLPFLVDFLTGDTPSVMKRFFSGVSVLLQHENAFFCGFDDTLHSVMLFVFSSRRLLAIDVDLEDCLDPITAFFLTFFSFWDKPVNFICFVLFIEMFPPL